MENNQIYAKIVFQYNVIKEYFMNITSFNSFKLNTDPSWRLKNESNIHLTSQHAWSV